MKLAMSVALLGEPVEEVVSLVQFAERIGIDSVWSSEEYGNDATSILAYLAARTTTIKLGTGIMQIPARTPANTAMTAMTLDTLSGGRFLLGLGMSRPWLIEGWHGIPYGRPLGRTREYVDVVRKAVARQERLEHVGEHYQIPYHGPGSTGRGKSVKSQVEPFRPRIPIYLAAIGPRNVALTGEIADGWLPAFYAPEHEAILTGPLDVGLKRSGRDAEDVGIAVFVAVVRADEVGEARDQLRPLFASYIGPSSEKNSYFDLTCAMGYEREAHAIREHYAQRRTDAAAAAVPDALIDEVALVGPLPAIVDRLGVWQASRVDTLVLTTADREILEAAQAVL